MEVKGRKELAAKIATVFGEKNQRAFYGTAGNNVR